MNHFVRKWWIPAGRPMTAAAAVLAMASLLAVAAASRSRWMPARKQAKSPEEEIHIPAGQENLPAEQVFKNITILKGKPASRLPLMMKALNQLLGVQCTYCHVKDHWEKEEPEAKLTTRHMFAMLKGINKTYFGGKNELSCWTCHRGHPKPTTGGAEIRTGLEELPADRERVINEIVEKLGENANKPAGQVFQNVHVLKGVPASKLPRVMAVFTVVLGTNCAHCHVPRNWYKDDKKAKKLARKMLKMVGGINQEYFNGQGKVACWMCHRGAVRPEFLPGQPVAD